jgi:tRNA A37 threonylcarbamoyladenosine biosynthesis protein TsaE
MILMDYLGSFEVCHSDLYRTKDQKNKCEADRELRKVLALSTVLVVCFSPGPAGHGPVGSIVRVPMGPASLLA